MHMYFNSPGDWRFRVPVDDAGNLDWEAAEVGTSEEYWQPFDDALVAEESAWARITVADLPENLRPLEAEEEL